MLIMMTFVIGSVGIDGSIENKFPKKPTKSLNREIARFMPITQIL